MSRKRPHLFGGSFSNERNVLPRFARDVLPEMSASERAAWSVIKPHLTRFIQRRRGIIGATVSAGAALAAEFIRGKASGNTPRVKESAEPDILSTSFDTGTTDSEHKSTEGATMTGSAVPMDTHGDGASAVDKPFNRDAEDPKLQQRLAASLWHRAPRIYDDEIIVRMPCIPEVNNTGSGNPFCWFPTAAAAGPPLVPTNSLLAAYATQLNNIFTPVPVTSTKPRGYTWYSGLYNLYQVLEVRWKIHTIAITRKSNSATSSANPPVADIPIRLYCTVGDNSHTAFAQSRDIFELGYSNGADKSIVIHGPVAISNVVGASGNVHDTVTFEGTWTPAMFEDLQTNITYQPMTGIGAAPNWGNYLDFGYINYNSGEAANQPEFQTKIYLEFLVHFKKVNMTRYATDD